MKFGHFYSDQLRDFNFFFNTQLQIPNLFVFRGICYMEAENQSFFFF